MRIAERHPERLAGIMVLSAYLLLADTLTAEATDANRDVPIFQAHGVQDPMVTIDKGRRTRDRLQEEGWTVGWHEYPMPHQVCPEEIANIGSWLGRVLSS